MKKALTSILVLALGHSCLNGQEIFLPSTLYVICDCENKTVLYPEGFIARCGQSLDFEGKRELAISAETDSITISSKEAWKKRIKTDIIPAYMSHIPSGAKARVLCIGESTTAMQCRNPCTEEGSPKNWVALVQEILSPAIHVTGDIGHGGWSSYTYLNWPCAAKLDKNAPVSFFKMETMWYALGLYTRTGQEFNASTEQLSLIALTPFGKYKMDGHPQLWKLVQHLGKREGYPKFVNMDNYDGSSVQIAQLHQWAEELMDNPQNPFYDKATARSTDHAFSLETFLERSGEQAPTHVVLNIGINDGDGSNSPASSRECFEKLLKCFGNLPVAHFVNRWPGVCDPDSWPEARCRKYDVNGNTANLLRLQKEWRTVTAANDNWYELDVWHCQYPASQSDEKMEDGILDCSRNDVHTGYMGIVTSAWQVAGWLCHCLSS
ncbi:MAG: SGNH/GDSL hydrolase family protein [Clostridium sp.]|nr:SGNH/GDSL hydrolase family protein [Bacteroides sp.]MCM1197571.1 SGNH/GDSL hydrolase family protein [Clostridium sp.]